MEVYFVYILYSQIKDRYYVGYTSDDLQERLRKHNSNHKGFTGGIRDWVVVYTETYSEKKDKQQPNPKFLQKNLYDLNYVYVTFPVNQHNSNHKGFTGGIRDWVVVYTETYSEKKDTMLREQQIKKWKSRKMVESLISSR